MTQFSDFSFVSPSSEELLVWKEISSKRLTIVHGFQPESENDSNQKEHLNRGAER